MPDVDILGHIFEQSITDLERLRLSLDQRAQNVGRCVPLASSSTPVPPKRAVVALHQGSAYCAATLAPGRSNFCAGDHSSHRARMKEE